MSLSVREKLTLQKIVREKQAALEQGGLKVREKLEAQKAMREALEKLLVKVEAGGGSPLLEALLRGDFNSLTPIAFIGKLREVVDSIGGEIEPVKPGVIGFVESKAANGELILEAITVDDLLLMLDEDNGQGVLEGAKPKRPTVPASDARKINDIIHEYGKQRWKHIPIDEILGKIVTIGYVPLQEDGTEWDGMLVGAEGRTDIPLAAKQQRHNGATIYPEETWMKQWLHLSWYRDKASNETKYELTGYLM